MARRGEDAPGEGVPVAIGGVQGQGEGVSTVAAGFPRSGSTRSIATEA